MTNKLADFPPTIVHLLTVMFDPSSADGERINAMRAFDRYLKSVGADGYECVDRITTEPVSDEQMQEVFDKGRELGRAETAVAVTTAPKPFFTPPSVSRSSTVYGFDDDDRISGNGIYQGYRWSDIAEHCADNSHCVPDKHRGFLADMADKLTRSYGTISGRQAKYLANLFTQHFGGRI